MELESFPILSVVQPHNRTLINVDNTKYVRSPLIKNKLT
jgi:hypothetical protein